MNVIYGKGYGHVLCLNIYIPYVLAVNINERYYNVMFGKDLCLMAPILVGYGEWYTT